MFHQRTYLSLAVRLRLFILALCVGYVGVPSTVATDETEAFDGAVVSLPPFYVEPENGEDWTRVTAEGFELLTTNDRTFARAFARSYFQQTHLISKIIPPRYLWQPHTSDTFIVVDRKNRRLETDNAIGRIIEEAQSHLTTRSARKHYLPNLRLVSADSSIIFAFLDEGDLGGSGIRNRQFFFENALEAPGESRRNFGIRFTTNRLHKQLATRAPALPLWTIAGLVDLYDHCEIARDRIVVGPLELTTLEVMSEFDVEEASETRATLALPLLHLLTHPVPADPESKLIWAKHAHLFVRWCLFADDGRFRDEFWAFVDDSVVKPAGNERFVTTFGLSIAEAQIALEQFVPTATSKKVSLKASRNLKQPEVKIESATRIEISRLLAEWERLETEHMRSVFPELTDSYLTRARKTIASARQNSANSTALQSTSGLLEYAAGNTATALVELQSAVASGETRPLVLQALARLLFEKIAADQTNNQPLQISDVQPAIDLLMRAHQTDPTFAAIYLDLSEIWDAAAYPLNVKEVAILAAGIRSFPRDLELVTRLVQMQAARGKWKTARSILQFAKARAVNTQAIQLLDELDEQLVALEPSS